MKAKMKGESNKAALALASADVLVQDVQRHADATRQAVRALLLGPDGVGVRMSVIDLVDRLAEGVFDVMNDINSLAEDHGVNFEDDRWRATHAAVHAAVRGEMR